MSGCRRLPRIGDGVASDRSDRRLPEGGPGAASGRSFANRGGMGEVVNCAGRERCQRVDSGSSPATCTALVAAASLDGRQGLYKRARVQNGSGSDGTLFRSRHLHRGTSTASTSAQTWFDRGLVWSYAFHHEEAIRCFERAVEHDAGFALARWGIAYTLGPNYNKQWEAFDPVDLAASLEKACDEVAVGTHGARIAPLLSSGRSSRRSGTAIRSTTRRPTSSRGTLTTSRRCVRCIGRIPTMSTSRRSLPTH